MFQSIVKYIFFEYFFLNRGVLRRDLLTKIKKNPKFDVIEKLAKVLKYFYFLLTFYPIFSPLLFAEAYFFYILFFATSPNCNLFFSPLCSIVQNAERVVREHQRGLVLHIQNISSILSRHQNLLSLDSAPPSADDWSKWKVQFQR